MINIPNKITPPLSQNQLLTLNNKVTQPLTKDTVRNLNTKQPTATPQYQQRAAFRATSQSKQRTVFCSQPQYQQRNPVQTFTPKLLHPVQKGQKTALNIYAGNPQKIRVCFGWNELDSRCDMDASAFLLGANGKVMGDEWLVFYNQPESPDRSTRFLKQENGIDREQICIDLGVLNPAIQKFVFVLTIDEAFRQNLNFSMISNAYIRLVNEADNQEIVSFSLAEYYSNVTSMTMAELYLHNGQWKFNPVGNGVHQDLAGQCRIYGVEIG